MVFLGNAITDAWKQNLMENAYQDASSTFANKSTRRELNPVSNVFLQNPTSGPLNVAAQVAAYGTGALVDKLPKDQQTIALLLANLAEIAATRSSLGTVKLPLFSQRF